MSKFIGIFVFITAFVAIQGRHVARRDVSELLKHHVPEHDSPVFGNGIRGEDATIEHEHSNRDSVGNYDFQYKQSDLQERQETGQVVQDPATGNYTIDNIVGSYRYVRPDGLWQIVEYRADADGFAPKITVEKYEGPF